MITVEVPDQTPFTQWGHGQRVFVMVAEEGEIIGVYASVERARLYCEDWVPDYVDAPVTVKENGGHWEVYVGEDRAYNIYYSCYRL